MTRELNFGTDATDADYQVRDSSSTGGDLIVEHLPTGAQFKYNATANRWELVDPLFLADEAADPTANGEFTRNGTDSKAYSGGAVRNLSNIGGGETTVSSNTTTSGEDVIYVDTSGGAVTITLSSTDATNGESVIIVNVDASNAVTVDTESTETIDPNAESSKTLSTAGFPVRFTADGTNWDSSLAAEYEEITTGQATADNETSVKAHRGTTQTGIASGTQTNIVDTEDEDNRNELDNNQNFSPDERGDYRVTAQVRLNSPSDNARARWAVRNTTDSTDEIARGKVIASDGGNQDVQFAWEGELNSAKNYRIVIEVDESYGVVSGIENTWLTIKRDLNDP